MRSPRTSNNCPRRSMGALACGCEVPSPRSQAWSIDFELEALDLGLKKTTLDKGWIFFLPFYIILFAFFEDTGRKTTVLFFVG